VESALDDDAYWGLLSLLELRQPMVIITQSQLLPRLMPFLHRKVRVVLVRHTKDAVLEAELHVKSLENIVGPADQEQLRMFPFARQWQQVYNSQNHVSAASKDAAQGDLEVEEGKAGSGRQKCNLRRLDQHASMVKHVSLNAVSWLHWAAIVNPWRTASFLW
jgi:hypothetical protein